MKEKITEVFISNYIKDLINEANNIFNDLYDEGVQFINLNIKNYLEKYQKKYSYLKTLLHGMTPVYLYDIYFHLPIENDKNLIYTESITNLLDISNRITIIGDAGSGKSTLIKHLFLNSIKQKVGIPILIELRHFNNNSIDLISKIKEEITYTGLVVNDSILERYLESGKFIFFLDGYDELKSNINYRVAKEINMISKKYEKNKYILTSRPYSNIELLSDFYNFKLSKLSSSDVNDFIKLQLNDNDEQSKEIINSLNENKYKNYIQSFLENPLLLTLYILTFQSNSEIPNKKYIFYRRVINALFSEHDSKTKLGFKREKKSNLTQEQFEEILKRFSFLTYFLRKFSFDQEFIIKTFKDIESKLEEINFDKQFLINDLLKSVALWIEDGGIYSFAHRSIQEYFAALFISSLSEKNKKSIYDKIDEILSSKRHSEMKNLLSLCIEVDEIDYSKFLRIPALKKVDKHLSRTENSDLKNYLTFLFNSIQIEGISSRKGKLIINDKAHLYALGISRSLEEEIISDNAFFIFSYIYDNEKEFREFLITKKLVSADFFVDHHIKRSDNFSKEINIIQIIPFLNNETIIRKCLDFKKYIKNEIKRLSEKIATSEKNDEDLLSMI